MGRFGYGGISIHGDSMRFPRYYTKKAYSSSADQEIRGDRHYIDLYAAFDFVRRSQLKP